MGDGDSEEDGDCDCRWRWGEGGMEIQLLKTFEIEIKECTVETRQNNTQQCKTARCIK